MNRITIDTDELRTLAQQFRAEADELAAVRLDLLRAGTDAPLGAFPGLERLEGMAEDVLARIAGIATTVSNQATEVDMQARAAETDNLLGRFSSGVLGTLGPMFGATAGSALGPWLPILGGSSGGMNPTIDDLLGIQSAPLLTGVGGVDWLADLGRHNGALAPISNLLNDVQGVLNDPLGLTGPLGTLASPAVSGVPSLQDLEQAALQQNITRIMNGGSFPGSDILGNFRNSFNGLFPGGVNNVINNTIAAAKADGTFHPGTNPMALQGVIDANNHFSDILSHVNFYQGIIDHFQTENIAFASNVASMSVG
jgi:hypothetical protein